MEKAYDFKELVEEFKGHGLNLLEEEAKFAVVALFDWLTKSAAKSEMPYDDVAVVLYPKAKEMILGLADKIDGQEG